MPRPHTPKLTKLDLLEYALESASTLELRYRGASDETFARIHKCALRDVKEIERRIKLCQLAAARKESQS